MEAKTIAPNMMRITEFLYTLKLHKDACAKLTDEDMEILQKICQHMDQIEKAGGNSGK